MPGSESIAIVVETSDGLCPIFCILDERWFPPEQVVAKMTELEAWLDEHDPVSPVALVPRD